ncbi:MAG TPA: PQQ-binding-like beta-propeller repeat protein, partial [Candidatus Paceibacterota bacterium]|nr:PQQ-binding-like beta-propeller repeat protein [Candidatus Paceibacterota bacterium]
MNFLYIIFSFLLFFSTTNWDTFRGNHQHTGFITTKENLPTLEKALWKYKTNGDVYSSPVIIDSKVYFGSNDCNFYCITADEGRLVWKKELGNLIMSSPIYYKGKIIVGCDDGCLYQLNYKTGEVISKFQSNGRIRSASVIYKDNIIFTSRDNHCYSITLDSSKLIWSYKTR